MTSARSLNQNAWRKRLIGEFSWRRAVWSALLIYGVVSAYLYFRMDAMIFLPQPASYRDGPGLLKLACADGRRITAKLFDNPRAHYTLLYSHGNAEDIGENLQVMAHLRELGFSVLIYDYHGYGTSEGTPGEATSELDIDAAYDYLVHTRGVSPDRLIAYGRSVGGGPTLSLASRKPVRALILESTFTDPASVVVPFRVLPFVKFPSFARLERLPLPVLVMHGLKDETIPAWHGQALYAAAPGPKFCLWVPGADHDDFKEVAGRRWDKALLDFAAYLDAHPPSGHS